MKYQTNDGKTFTLESDAITHALTLNPIDEPVIIKSVIKKVRKKYDNTLPKRYLSYLKRSNVKGLPFELSIEEFDNIMSLSCVYCGSDSQITIDRIDSKEGYILDNCQPCCYKCNMMKFTLSNRDFIQQVKKICNYLK